MIDMLRRIEKILGYRLRLHDMGPRAGDAKYAVADTGKIRRELGWQPRVSLEAGLRKTIRYYRNLYRSIG